MRRNQSSSGFDSANLTDFIAGFGTENMDGDFWLGLETMHKLTQHMPHTMRIELTDSFGTTAQADYGATRVRRIIYGAISSLLQSIQKRYFSHSAMCVIFER